MGEPKELNPHQERFCQEYVLDYNGKQAAIRAGYAVDSAAVQASRLLTYDNVSMRIKELSKNAAEINGITAEYVLNGIKEVAERCLQKKAVMEWDHHNKEMVQAKDEDGNYIWQFDSYGANKAFEMLGKHTGIFEKDNSQKKNQTEVLIIEGKKFSEIEDTDK